MPSVMRLVWPFIFRVATKSPKIYTYANHPVRQHGDIRRPVVQIVPTSGGVAVPQ